MKPLWLTLRSVVFLFVLLGIIAAAFAATDVYEYDPLGRLIRWTDAQGRVTEYRYDAVGNILEVKRLAAPIPAPTVTATTPTSLRRGETRTITLAGANLMGASVSTSATGLSIASVQSTATQISFSLTASTSATLGANAFVAATPQGMAGFSISIAPQLPTLSVTPTPLAIPIDNTDRRFTVRLSNADIVDRVISLSSSNASIAAVSPSSVTVMAGQTEADALIRGVQGGIATISLSATGLASTSVAVYVTAEFAGINVATAPVVGVVLPSSPTSAPATVEATSPALGVAFGRHLRSVSPNSFVMGTGPTSINIAGEGLEGVTGISVIPPDGVTVTNVVAAGDGRSISATVTITATATVSQRQIILVGAGAPYIPTRADADRINVTLPIPEIQSIDPYFGVRGTSSISFIVRGRNLSGATGISFAPAEGLVVGATPSVTPDGTQLTVGLSIALNAATGSRLVTVQTPAGSSDTSLSPANTFAVVSAITSAFSPIVSPAVGVVLSANNTGSSSNVEVATPALGVAFGAVATALLPNAQQFGTSGTLVIQGAGLQGVTAVTMVPPDGIVLGAPTPSVDGTSVSIPITIEATAVQTVREVLLIAGTQRVLFAPASQSQFRVTGPMPQLTSVTPQILQVGTISTIQLNGANFQNVSEIRVVPPTGISVGTPVVSVDNTTITVPFAVAANAPTGARNVIVVTPAGETSSIVSPANTITIFSGSVTPIDRVLAPLVGVVVQAIGGGNNVTTDPVVSPLLGVLIPVTPPSATSDVFVNTAVLGVALGPVAITALPLPLNLGASGTLVVTGVDLSGVSSVNIYPPNDITLGTPVPSGDGLSVSIPITVASTAAISTRQVSLAAGATRIPFAVADASLVYVTGGVPRIDSIEPILGARGTSLSLTVRGANLQFARAVTVTPASGVSVVNQPTWSADGTQLTLSLVIAANASVGARVIQVVAPGGTSSAAASPANTFTIN
jgi:YD repeat-containing protein